MDVLDIFHLHQVEHDRLVAVHAEQRAVRAATDQRPARAFRMSAAGSRRRPLRAGVRAARGVTAGTAVAR